MQSNNNDDGDNDKSNKQHFDKQNKKKGVIPPSSVAQKGVRLKHFEAILTKILLKGSNEGSNSIHYMKLPSLNTNKIGDNSSNWPFDILPPSAGICGKRERVWKKEAQIRSMIQCILKLVPENNSSTVDDNSCEKRRRKIVDFGGGGGNLAIPLALLLPEYDVVIVDLKVASLSLARLRASFCQEEISNKIFGSDEQQHVKYNEKMVKELYRGSFIGDKDLTPIPKNVEFSCEGLPNLKLFHGDIRGFQHDFDIGLALHACGEATDLAMNLCNSVGAAMVVAPCCVGKLNSKKKNNYIYHPKRVHEDYNESLINYPRSLHFRSNLSLNNEEFGKLASAGDYGEVVDMHSSKGAFRRAAKTLIEHDRISWAKECGYDAVLTRMEPWNASPKNDIIIAQKKCRLVNWSSQHDCPISELICTPCRQSDEDLEVARRFLVGAENTMKNNNLTSNANNKMHEISQSSSTGEWTRNEIDCIQVRLDRFVENTKKSKLAFEKGLGPRKRKLVHHLAANMGLRHWSEGDKGNKNRIVVVSK